MAVGTLLVLDASLPGGLIEGTGTLRYAQTMAFTTLMLFQLFNVFNARSDERSAFDGLFRNRWLWAAIGLSLLLQVAVVYVPFLQQAFSTDEPERARLAALRGGGELGAVAARTEQTRHAPRGGGPLLGSTAERAAEHAPARDWHPLRTPLVAHGRVP